MSNRLRTAARRAAMVALAGACGTAAAQGQEFTMGYSVGFLTDPFQAIQVDLTMAEAEKAGLQTLPVANANGDAGKQITDFHNLIAQGAQGIIVVPTDSDAIVPALSYAAEPERAGGGDRHRAGGRQGRDDRARRQHPHGRGRLPGDGQGARRPGHGPVDDGRPGDDQRPRPHHRLQRSAWQSSFPDIEVIEQPTYWKTDRATSVAQTVVTSTPDLAGIYMQSDAVMLAGVLNVLKSADRLTKVGEPEPHLSDQHRRHALSRSRRSGRACSMRRSRSRSTSM